MEACQQIYPMELQEPSGLIASCRLRTYQKQSLAFMVNREQGKHDPDYVESSILGRKLFRRQKGKSDYEHRFSGIKTGMLCSEVGMGKTLVCIALICANPGSYKRISDAKFAIATAALKTRDYSKDNKQHNARSQANDNNTSRGTTSTSLTGRTRNAVTTNTDMLIKTHTA